MGVLDLPTQFRGFCGDPESELEVVFLLGLAQEYLPFPLAVTAINDAFPDCEGVDPTNGKPVTIEIEVRSRNFQDHNHDQGGCDYIICWEDNWPDAPLPVVSLKELFRSVPALAAKFIDRPHPGSLRAQLQERLEMEPTRYEAVTHFLDTALPELQRRLPAVVVDDRLSKHYLVRYGGSGIGLLGVYPSGKLVCARVEHSVARYGRDVAEPVRALRAAVRQIGTLRSKEQVPVLLDALGGLVDVIARVERARA